MAARSERTSAKPKKGAATHAKPASGSARPAPKVGKSSPKVKIPAPPARVRRTMPAPPPPPKPKSTEERMAAADARLARASAEFRRAYLERFDMSWVYHDAALEGVVYTQQELQTAVDPNVTLLADSSLQPIYEEIRRHRKAIQYCREMSGKKQPPVSIDTIKQLFFILHPEDGDARMVKFRKDIPQHRLYFHEYAAPDRIAVKVRQVIDWVNDPETGKTRSAMRVAARAHYDLVRTFPFAIDSGKVGRLFMNLLLMRSGNPPAIIHSAERQRYYEGIKGSALVISAMVQESIENALASVEKLLDEYETRTRSFG